MRGRVSALVGALLFACAQCHAVLDYGGGWLYDTTLSGPGWHAYESAGNVIYFGGADGEWRRISPSQLAIGDGIGASVPTRDICFALVLKNTTTNVFHCFAIGFYSEQWRVNAVSPSTFRLLFDWGVSMNFIAEQPNGVANPSTIIPHTADKPGDFARGYSGVSGEMHAQAFIYQTTHMPLDGNKRANRRRHFAVADRVHWMPGEHLVLRWFANYDTGVLSQELAIDDLWFRAAKEGEIDFLGANVTGAPPQFVACGFPAVEHEVQESVDLKQWLPFTTVSSESGKLALPSSMSGPQRFFRIVKP